MEGGPLQDAAENVVRKAQRKKMPNVLETRHMNASSHSATISNAEQSKPVPGSKKKSKELVDNNEDISTPSTSGTSRHIEKGKRKWYCCKYCNMGLGTKIVKDSHEKRCKSHPNSRGLMEQIERFECQYCKCCLITEQTKIKHERCCPKRERHGDTERNAVTQKAKKFVCTECEYSTNNSASIKKHTRMVHNKETAETLYCNSQGCSFKTVHQSSLYAHARTHQSSGKFVCQYCNIPRYFNHKVNLDVHVFKNHQNERNAQESITNKINICNICNYKVIKLDEFRRHLMIHDKNLNTNKYVCDICQYSTNMRCSLIRHVRTHSNSKLFVCPSCTKGFNQKVAADKHILRHHKDEELRKMITNKIEKCTKCDYEFIGKNTHKCRRTI